MNAAQTEDAPQTSLLRLMLVVGGVLYLMIYDDQVFDLIFQNTRSGELWASLAAQVTDLVLALVLVRGRVRAFLPWLVVIVALDALAYFEVFDGAGVILALSLLWLPLLYTMARKLLGEHDGDPQLLIPIFVGAAAVYVANALWGPVITNVQTQFFQQATGLIPVLVVGLILERGLRIDSLRRAEQRALVAYTLAAVVLGLVAAMCALVPGPARLAGTWELYTFFTFTVNGVVVALATIVFLGAGAHPEWERRREERD